MTARDGTTADDSGRATRRIGWWLAALMLLSFAFGVAMFLPPEHRAQKYQEMKRKFEAKRHQPSPVPADPAARMAPP